MAFGNLAAIAIHNANSYKNAITDRLTKMYNFGYFTEQLYKEFSKAKRYNYPVSLIIIDIDHFKNYNDSNGHQEGNVALVKTAGIIMKNARDSDTVARYGGEEFILMLPQTTGPEGQILAERIRHNIETTSYSGDEKQPSGKVTISCGIASFPEDGNTSSELIEKADMALYYSKNNGRNRVTLYNR
jgi:diguanylate cyclase (GGDEF)-like protein